MGVKTEEGDLTCRLLLGCDGANSVVRKKAGLASYTKDYHQRGFVCTVEVEAVDDNTCAFQRFLPGGEVVALLPCGADQMSLVWSCASAKAKSFDALTDELLARVRTS